MAARLVRWRATTAPGSRHEPARVGRRGSGNEGEPRRGHAGVLPAATLGVTPPHLSVTTILEDGRARPCKTKYMLQISLLGGRDCYGGESPSRGHVRGKEEKEERGGRRLVDEGQAA